MPPPGHESESKQVPVAELRATLLDVDTGATRDSQENNMIEAALKESRGRVSGPTGAAAKLGIPRSTLESKIRSLKIAKNHFRE
jgi:transcriptional regulator of acetoin/glycerol metabolism